MKKKFTKSVFAIFVICVLMYLFVLGYFKSKNSNINSIILIIILIILSVGCITGIILIILGIRNIIKFLQNRGNISMKKIICLLIVVGLCSYYGGSLIAKHKVDSQNSNNVTSESNETDTQQQNDNSGDQTDDTTDTTDTSVSGLDTELNSTNIDSRETSSNTPNSNINSSGKLTSSDGYLELESKYGGYDNITGVIKNLSPDSYRYVEVNINLYDANGNQVESTLANTNNLEANGAWNFSAPVLYPDKSTKFRIISIDGMR